MNRVLEAIFLHSRVSAWAWSFSLGFFQKKQPSPEGLWQWGGCPHQQLASRHKWIWSPKKHDLVSFPKGLLIANVQKKNQIRLSFIRHHFLMKPGCIQNHLYSLERHLLWTIVEGLGPITKLDRTKEFISLGSNGVNSGHFCVNSFPIIHHLWLLGKAHVSMFKSYSSTSMYFTKLERTGLILSEIGFWIL